MFASALVLSVVAGLASLTGAFLVIKSQKWIEKNLIYLISFSAGVLVSFAINHLIPEAVELNESAFVWLTLSFLIFYLIEHTLTIHVCSGKEHCETHETFTLVTFVGMMLHSLIDGLIIGIGFEVSTQLGIASALAVLLHRLPDGVSTVAAQLYGGRTVKQATNSSFWVAVMTPIGTVLALLLLGHITDSGVGLLLALAGGSFLYVGASELIPEIHRHSKWGNILLTVLGACVPFLIEKMVG